MHPRAERAGAGASFGDERTALVTRNGLVGEGMHSRAQRASAGGQALIEIQVLLSQVATHGDGETDVRSQGYICPTPGRTRASGERIRLAGRANMALHPRPPPHRCTLRVRAVMHCTI